MTEALAGIRVLDLSNVLAGPFRSDDAANTAGHGRPPDEHEDGEHRSEDGCGGDHQRHGRAENHHHVEHGQDEHEVGQAHHDIVHGSAARPGQSAGEGSNRRRAR